ncbi:hypothetical protein [Streptomyces kanamyceticus]|nr:hypothetical protein [Streptomyces kanamyceticus]
MAIEVPQDLLDAETEAWEHIQAGALTAEMAVAVHEKIVVFAERPAHLA